MRHKLLKKMSTEERDKLKGKIEAQEDYDSIVNSVPDGPEKHNKLKAFFLQEDSSNQLLGMLLRETNERIENKIISRVKHFEALKKKFLKI